MTAPNDDALPALDKEQDDDAWKSIIPGGVTPQEYAAVSPPQSPQPVRREIYEPEKMSWGAPTADEMQGPGFENGDEHLRFYMFCFNLARELAVWRRYLRTPSVVRARHGLGYELSPPRPKFPANEAWFRWLRNYIKAMIEECGAVVSMPIEVEMPDQGCTAQEFYERVEDWYERASEWYNLHKDEEIYVRIAIVSNREKDSRKAAAAQRPRLNEDLLAAVVPIRIQREIYAADPTAPRRLRHYFPWAWTRIPPPPGYDPDCSLVIISNVDYICALPPLCAKQLRVDSKYGPHEATRYPQWHELGQWHMAFIPTDLYNRIVELLEHSRLDGDMEFYVVDLDMHFTTRDWRSYKPTPALKASLARYWDQVLKAFRSLNVPKRLLAAQPFAVVDRGRRTMMMLFTQWLPKRDVIETVSAWQRCVAELRGWIKFVKSTVWLEGWIDGSHKKIDPGVDLRVPQHRLPTRGVITDDEYVATLYAQFGLPVWLVQGHKVPFWSPDPTSNEVRQSPPYECETRVYENDEGEARRQPAYLNAVQDYWNPPQAVPAEEPQASSSAGPQQDDEDVVMYDAEEEEPGSSAAAAGEGKKSNKRKRTTSSLYLPKGPRTKRPKTYPEWWLKEWTVAFDAIHRVPLLDSARVCAGWKDAEFPVPKGTGLLGLYASPVLEHFATSENERNRTKLFTGYVQLRDRLLFALATTAIRDLQVFQALVWKKVLSGHIGVHREEDFMQRMGFAREQKMIAVDDSNQAGYEKTIQMAKPPLASDVASTAPSTRAPSPSSTAPPPPSTAATSRPASPIVDSDYGNDTNDEPDMTYRPRDGRTPPPVPPKYFRPEFEACDPPLLLEAQRYEAEPSGWHFKARGQKRAEDDFTWWTEVDSDDKEPGVLEFVYTSKKKVNEFLDDNRYYDIWWDYEHHWVFIFEERPSSSEGRVSGERLTQPLRLWTAAGTRTKPKWQHGTGTTPMQLRLWHAQPTATPVFVPDGALGAVGWRAKPDPVPAPGEQLESRRKWHLDDADYEHIFPTAPRIGVRPQLVIDVGKERGKKKKATSTASASAPASPRPPPVPVPDSMNVDPPVEVESHDPVEVPAGPRHPLKEALAPKPQMFFENTELTPYDLDNALPTYSWPSSKERALIIWDIAELSFRLQLFQLDDKLRTLYQGKQAKFNVESNNERQVKICKIWDSDTFVPQGASPLANPYWEMRISAVLAFYDIVSSWPRTTIPVPPEAFKSEEEFLNFESAVWEAYATVYVTYLYREAPIPLVHPDDVSALAPAPASTLAPAPAPALASMPAHVPVVAAVAPSQL
ncbi:hypothetical protein AURDEDRAFT_177787 [Auricularia subglabra TFB-10046 SS5]|uniref:Uncharacterized protein n=1 Tax=Auricularia subglabra (strain TFB-10046 / SS5) TaxID=717982 RepID=J0D388_AURST|nr:hypothetical protein AURDEDRAFT_177787 [Auricularia subglabra TFB-10046 SS5]